MIDQVTSVLRWRLRMAGGAGRKQLFGELGPPLQEGKPQRPVQGRARNYATHNLAPPHSATLGGAFHLLGCVGR